MLAVVDEIEIYRDFERLKMNIKNRGEKGIGQGQPRPLFPAYLAKFFGYRLGSC
jgi:hypothetical protein